MRDIKDATMTRNILKTYRQATDAQRHEGMTWYDEAHNLAASLDSDVDRAAGIIAALSPQMSWNRNAALAVRLYADGALDGGALSLSIANAARILAGEDWRDVLGKNALKTRNFAECISDPSSAQAVCVDRHAIAVALERGGKLSTTPGQYARISDAYRRAAKRAGISPAQMQAVTWVVWRETRSHYAAAQVRKAFG